MFGLGKTKVKLNAPFAGKVVDITEVPDPVFSQKILGEGYATIPDGDSVDICAPVDGKLVKVYDTLHAFAMYSTDGLEILVHIGLDTVELGGKHFKAAAEQGATVTAGTPVVHMDAAAVKEAGYNVITPVVFTKRGQVESVKVDTGATDGKGVVCTATLA